MLLALGLPSAAVANDTIEINAGAENDAGDKLDVSVTGANVASLTGTAKLDCKESGDQVELPIVSSNQDGGEDACRIRLTADLDGAGGADPFPAIVIDICNATPEMVARDNITSDCTVGPDPGDLFFPSGAKELDLSIKGL